MHAVTWYPAARTLTRTRTRTPRQTLMLKHAGNIKRTVKDLVEA